MLLRSVRLLDAAAPVDVRVRSGRISELAAHLQPATGEEVHDAAGAIAIPGLWDQHVHVGQVAQGYSRMDTTAATSTGDLLAQVAAALRDRPTAAGALVGFGHRLVDLHGTPTVAALDEVAPTLPVVLIGGDAHHAWMNTPALHGLGLAPHEGIVGEEEWFRALAHLDDLPGVAAGLEAGVRLLQRDALARGVTGICDMEWAPNWRRWQQREALLRVRTATYIGDMDQVPGPTGTPISADGLVTMGPLKVILDGALGSRSALCRDAYGALGPEGRGVLSVEAPDLLAALERADALGLDAAVHAIGDAATGIALEAFGQVSPGTGPPRIEHAQMLTDGDIAAMAGLGVIASVQPAHLLDDRDPTEDVWGRHADEAYRFADLQRAHVPMIFGSDAPVAPVDPWLAMSAAVHRSADARPSWFPAQQLQPREALACSTDGVRGLAVGGVADIVLLAEDPFAPVPRDAQGLMIESATRDAAARLRAVQPIATLVGGELRFSR